MEKRTIYIASCEPKKSGEKNGRKWTLYTIKAQDGTYYSTFEAKYQAMVGSEVEVEVENRPWTGKDGKQRDGWTIVEPKRGNQLGDLLKRIAAIEYRLDELEAGRGANVVAGMREIKKADIRPEDLPI